MSNSEKAQKEELKKLEDQAYFELCQIIAEAMQIQDIELLDYRITNWKNKYKKLLDNPSPNFKKRIEFLLNQYYSSVTQYIMSQIKFKEQKKIENQLKALRELYLIIKNTNDLPLLKEKVAKWEKKYPVSAFLKMYQKKIESYTRQKNLQENAFEQEKAFNELVDITKINGTFDELKEKFEEWEKKYSINDKYTIDDFIKHQSEIRRFSSDDYLRSIAREEKPAETDEITDFSIEAYNSSDFSSLSVQATAYSSLKSIAQKPNNIDEVFNWVYKNNSIKFNDKYKELILSAIYLDYSPKFLNSLDAPKINISNNSLSFGEYKNISAIKRYAVISYFNLLLPPDKAVSNNYFNKYIREIYLKSRSAKILEPEDTTLSTNDIIASGIEFNLAPVKKISTLDEEKNFVSDDLDNSIDNKVSKDEFIVVKDSTLCEESVANKPAIEQPSTKNTVIKESVAKEPAIEKASAKDALIEEPISKEPAIGKASGKDTVIEKSVTKEPAIEKTSAKDTVIEESVINEPEIKKALKPEKTKELISAKTESSTEDEIKPLDIETDKEDIDTSYILQSKTAKKNSGITEKNDIIDVFQEPKKDISSKHSSTLEEQSQDLDYSTIVAISPEFFNIIHNYSQQAVLVNSINKSVNKYVNSQKEKNNLDLNLDNTIRNKN